MCNLLKHRGTLQARAILIAPFLLLITMYQHTLSPDHGPLKHLYPYGYCRHSPTCSEYAKEQLQEKGLVIGGLLAIKRVLFCNPFAPISAEKWQEMAKRQISSL
jgi:putative membrane protein insertion efficiency factor